jgi:hypothetical protein
MEMVDDTAEAMADQPGDPAVEVAREFARAEWRMWSTFLDLHEHEVDAINDSDAPPLVRQVELSFIPNELAQRVHWSEGQISHLVAKARRLRDKTPNVWEAFSDGRIDGPKAREIASAVDKLERGASIDRLDRQAVGYAETHTLAEVRRWLKRFIARVEADLFNERAERERADRRVDVIHGDDGMSWMSIYGQSHVLAAVDKRLTKEAKALGADDPRTLQQRRADLFAAWMTTNEAGHAALNADIAVIMTAEALAGACDDPAVAADGSWVVPTAWILELAKYGGNNIFWHRMVLDPVTDDVLAHEYQGRFAPEILAKAIEFRDGVCQAPGCCRPASQCDIDHRIPHEADGPTAGWNLGPYCRRHHIQKGFGLLDIGPTAKSPPGRSRNTPLHSVGAPEIAVSSTEREVERILVDWIHVGVAA